MNSRHRQTLERIFEHPVPSNIRWRAIENLFVALGAEVEEREGSRVSVTLSGEVAVFHRPHPKPDTKQRAVSSVRRFLELTGNTP